MPGPYVPNRDADFLQWVRAFSNLIAAGPAAYGLTPADAAALVALADDFDACLSAATNQATRTAVTVNAKDTSRVSATQFYRGVAQRIKLNDGVSDSDKIALGLHLRPRKLTRRRAPETSPILKFIAATPGAHTLHFADSLTPNTRKKPFGAKALQLFMAVSESRVRDPNQARYVTERTRCPFGVDHDFQDAGKVASYFGRWVGTRGDHGPWSLPLHVNILFSSGAEKRSNNTHSADSKGSDLRLTDPVQGDDDDGDKAAA